MADKDLKIQITTAADLEGAKQAEAGIKSLGAKVEEAGQKSEKAAEQKRKLREMVQGLSASIHTLTPTLSHRERGGLGGVLGALINPISAVTLAVGAGVAAVRSWARELGGLNETVRRSEIASTLASDLGCGGRGLCQGVDAGVRGVAAGGDLARDLE